MSTVSTNGNTAVVVTFDTGGVVNVYDVSQAVDIKAEGRFVGSFNSDYNGTDTSTCESVISGLINANIQS